MLIKSLASWAGADFSVDFGETIEVEDDVGEARIAAGVAEAVPESPPAVPTRKVTHGRGK